MSNSTLAAAEARPPQPPHASEQLVLATIRDHAEPLLRIARRHSLCADDAFDAYQRALEIFLRNADRLDPERASNWLYTVCKHEAMAVRRQRQKLVGEEEAHLEALESRTAPSPEEQVISAERIARSAEALRRLKPQEVRALWLRAEGRSYQEICEETSWTYTKVNRCLAEGRASFLAKYAGIESGEECRRLAPALSAMVDGEALPEQLVELRAHLRHCGGCRAAVRELHDTARPLALVLPGLALAGGPPAGDGSLLDRAAAGVGRFLEALGHGLHERAASMFVRGQALTDAASAGKVAAIAAAAVASGGAIVVGAAPHAHGAHHRAVAHHARRAPAAVPTLAVAPAPEPAAPRAEPPSWPAPAPVSSHHRARHRRAASRSTGEPLVDPVESAPSPTPQPQPAAPTAEPEPAPHPSPADSSSPAAGGEFGFESP